MKPLNDKPGLYICAEKDCGNAFTITERDLEHCKEHGWHPPIRCQPCRRKRRALGINAGSVGAD